MSGCGRCRRRAVVEIAELLDLTPSQVQDTLTFYGFFKQDAPHGRLRIWLCRSISCHLRGADELLALPLPADRHPAGGSDAGWRADGGVRRVSGSLRAGAVRAGGRHVARLPDQREAGSAAWNRGSETRPIVADCEPVLLANIAQPRQPHAGRVRGHRRLSDLAHACWPNSRPQDVQDLVKASALRGRGGAGFPTGLKWSFLAKDRPGPIYFCLNADESEPGTFNNRILMELDPHQVLEGLIISCFATRASTAYFYLRYEYPLAYQRVQAAVDECYAAGYLGPAHSRFRLFAGCLPAPGRRRLHLRRRDRLDREPGRQTGLAADQAAVPGRRRCLSPADGGQQRGDGGLRQAHLRTRIRRGSVRWVCLRIPPTRAIRAALARNCIASADMSNDPAVMKRRWA